MANETAEKPEIPPDNVAVPAQDDGSPIQPSETDPKGPEVGSSITGYDHERMKDRGLLTAEEKKKLLRRVDLRLMILCAVIFMVKNVDANNVSL